MLTEYLLRVALLGSTWVLYLLLFLSVVSLAAIAERVWFFRKHGGGGKVLRTAVTSAIGTRDDKAVWAAIEASDALEARVLKQALPFRTGGTQAFEQAVESVLGADRDDLDRGLTLLGTLGNNAPFVGLFGTVLGVIEAFSYLGDGAGNGGAMGNVMSGIAEALVATGVGIFVAIPAVVAYNYAQKWAGDIEGNTRALAQLLAAWIETHASQTPRNS
jgi:biopolymer transport protein ExbB/TolQ